MGNLINSFMSFPSTVDSTDFIITVKTDNAGTSLDNQFTLPINIAHTYDYDVVTSDGQSITNNTGELLITFPSAGTYDINISGLFPQPYFFSAVDSSKLIDIKNWGNSPWVSMAHSFRNCNGLGDITATDSPDFSNLTDISSMFRDATITSLDVSGWDMSTITNMNSTFKSTGLTFLDVANWDVSSTTNFSATFQQSTFLVTDVTNWNTSAVTSIEGMFFGVRTLDFSLANWDITSMNKLESFNASNVIGMSVANYDATLIGWAAQTITYQNETVDFGVNTYTLGGAAQDAHDFLTAVAGTAGTGVYTGMTSPGWTINDGGGI